MKLLLDIFLTFARIGLFTFGGGYAMLPMLERELVEKKHWVTEEDLANYFAIGQCTPGIIAVNTATFTGHKLKKIPGAIFATLGVIFPSIVIILFLAAFVTHFAEIEWVQHAFAGIRACVCVLIFFSVLKLGKQSVKNLLTWGVFLVVLALAMFTNISTVLLVIAVGIFGVVFTALRERSQAK